MKTLTFDQKIVAAHAHFILGITQHDIAAIMSVNQGRINEACKAIADGIKNG